MPRNDDDDDVGDEKSKEAPKSKARLHPRLVNSAKEIGLTQADIEACENSTELSNLIQFERQTIEHRKSLAGNSGNQDQGKKAESEPAPKPKTPEYVLDLGENAEEIDARIRKAIQTLGNDLLKATKRGDQDRISALEEEITSLKEERERERQANSPQAKIARKVLAKYPQLFATQEERDEDPSSIYAANVTRLHNYVMINMRNSGRQTGDLERDMNVAIAHLFPGMKPAGAQQEDHSSNGNGKGKKTKAEEWSDAGTPPASQRASADNSGKPGGKRAAAAKVREKLRESGYDAGDDDDDLDDEI